MPKRSTPFQAIVRMVREQFAGPGVTVTESKELIDQQSGVRREVDIAIEGELDGEPICISMEVRERKRSADISWVQEMIAKHRTLVTNRLLLVSKSGFSASALKVVEADPCVEALTPEEVVEDGQPSVRTFYIDQISYDVQGCNLHVRTRDGSIVIVGDAGFEIHGRAGEFRGFLMTLANELVRLPFVGKQLSIEAHDHPDRMNVSHYTFGVTLEGLGYSLRESKSNELHLIEAIDIRGSFQWKQTPLALTLSRLGAREYESGHVSIANRPTVWVVTNDTEAEATTFSFQATDSNSAQKAAEVQTSMQFPELTRLFPVDESMVDR